MFTTINDFVHVWSKEFEQTQKVLKHLNDRSLAQAVVPGGRTIGILAWHIVTTISEMMNRTGLTISEPGDSDSPPSAAKAIFDAYNRAAEMLLNEVKTKWTDASLAKEDDMYGEQWKRGITLEALVFHQIHHRAQITVLMRQAGLRVPGMYGPSKEEWAAMGMKAPA
ncbi:MAG: DinB family protein [Bacteroidota bacterium]